MDNGCNKVRKIIITADDYGMSKIYNDIIEDLIVKDILSSVSVMVKRKNGISKKSFAMLPQKAHQHNVSIGLHFEAREGDKHDDELQNQISKFKKYTNCSPDYIDIHAPHKLGKDLENAWGNINKLGYPVRNMGQVNLSAITTSSAAQIALGLDEANIINWLSNLSQGVHEIVFHPGKYDLNCKSSLNKDRELEAKMVKKIRAFIEEDSNFIVSNYNELIANN